MIDLTEPNAPVAAHGIRIRLLRILLLIPPVLPIVQLATVWPRIGTSTVAPYFATMQGMLVICWVSLTVSIGGLLRRRSRLVERKVRRILAAVSASIAVVGGLGVGLFLAEWIAVGNTINRWIWVPPRWDASLAVAMGGLALSGVVLLGWPRSGLAWVRRTEFGVQVRAGRLVPGILLVLAGSILAHFGDRVVQPRLDPRPNSTSSELHWHTIGHSLWLPLAYGLLAAIGWLLISLAFLDDLSQAVAFGYSAIALVWIAAQTNTLTGVGLPLAWYGALPLVFVAVGLIRWRRQREAARTP